MTGSLNATVPFQISGLYGEILLLLLERAKDGCYFAVPFPAAVYDSLAEATGAAGYGTKSGSTARTHPPPSAEGVRGLPRTRAVVWVLTDYGSTMSPLEIWEELVRLGRRDPRRAVSVTAYDLWRRGRIGRAGRAMFYPLAAEAV